MLRRASLDGREQLTDDIPRVRSRSVLGGPAVV
jgi:hypothetical protein